MIFMTVGCSWCVFLFQHLNHMIAVFLSRHIFVVGKMFARPANITWYIHYMIVYLHHNILTPDNSYK